MDRRVPVALPFIRDKNRKSTYRVKVKIDELISFPTYAGHMHEQSQVDEWKNLYGVPSALNCKSISIELAPCCIAQSIDGILFVM